MPAKGGAGKIINEKKRASKYKSSIHLDSQTKADNRKKIWVEGTGVGFNKKLTSHWEYVDDSKDSIEEVNGISTGKNANEETQHAGKNHENILHKFASYNTIFTLSGLGEEELKSQKYFSNAPHDIIARTGGIGDAKVTMTSATGTSYESQVEKLERRTRAGFLTGEVRDVGTSYEESLFFLQTSYDIFFENVNILSTTGPNTERGLANFTKMEFELHEPFGISLVEKIRAATFINGYLDYMDAPLLLTIEWKGWDEHGKEVKDSTLVRKIPIRVVKVAFEVDAGGAKYQCVAVAADDFAYDDRFKFPRRNITITRSTWDDWQKSLKEQLDEQMDDEIKEGLRQYKDEYNFLLSKEVREDCKDWGNAGTLVHQSTQPGMSAQRRGANKSATIAAVDTTVDSYTSLVKLFEDAIRNGLGYTKIVNEFWYRFARKLMNESNSPKNEESMEKVTEYLISAKFQEDLKKEENQYINWFMIKPKFEVIGSGENKKWDSIRKLHPKK